MRSLGLITGIILLYSSNICAQSQIVELKIELETPQVSSKRLVAIKNRIQYEQFKRQEHAINSSFDSCLYQWGHNKIPLDCFRFVNLLSKQFRDITFKKRLNKAFIAIEQQCLNSLSHYDSNFGDLLSWPQNSQVCKAEYLRKQKIKRYKESGDT